MGLAARQFQSREQRVIEQVGRQTMGFAMAGPLWVIQRVLNHPHDDAVAVLVSIARRGINLGQKRAIRQSSDRPQDQVAFETNQESGAPRVQFFPMCVAEKAAIFRQQGVGRKVVPELLDQFLRIVRIGGQTLFLVSKTARKNREQSLTPSPPTWSACRPRRAV